MDDAERWLATMDPDYTKTARSWRHVASGEYRGPRAELPLGDVTDLELAVITGGTFVEHGGIGERACHRCGSAFKPREAAHQFCGDICRADARRKYQRDLMRLRRAA